MIRSLSYLVISNHLRGAALISGCEQVHLLQDHAQRQDRCLRLDDRTAQDRSAEVDGAAVLDVGSLHLQRHVLEAVKLQDAADNAIGIRYMFVGATVFRVKS